VSVDRAVEILKAGGLVALPTETVYGLAADAENELAVRRIFAVKGRPSSHPLIVHLGEVNQLSEWARTVPVSAQQLAAAFWPGPLTLVLPRSARAADFITGGQDTVALRVPNHPLALAVLREFGGGLAAPSANKFGHLSPTTAQHVISELGDEVDLIFDGGPCTIGVESTIVDLSTATPRLLRPGGVPREHIEAVLGAKLQAPATDVRAPGMLASHYAPRAGLVLTAQAKVADEAAQRDLWGASVAVLSVQPPSLPPSIQHFPLPADPTDAARVLYATLRQIDEQGFDVIVAVLPPETGLGLAVRDRLTRAAAPRPSVK
jgi:L-threonylcarbamoyladenylate synthase